MSHHASGLRGNAKVRRRRGAAPWGSDSLDRGAHSTTEFHFVSAPGGGEAVRMVGERSELGRSLVGSGANRGRAVLHFKCAARRARTGSSTGTFGRVCPAMDARYEPFCFADPVFYDAPERWQRTVADFAAAGQPVPTGWRREDRDLWAVYQLEDVRLPLQGWKIHVSATPQNAEQVLEKVCGYCFDRRIAFKFLRGPAALLMQNSKYAPRGASGKLLTLYPLDEVELERTLTELDAIVGGEPGPYVLSDLRWNAGPLYTRFGAFAEFYHVGADGSRELALRRPGGSMESDRR